jgi:hypothetical protein
VAKNTKFERLKKRLKDELDFDLIRNDPERAMGWVNASWKTGYSVCGSLSGAHRWTRFNTLKEVEESLTILGNM